MSSLVTPSLDNGGSPSIPAIMINDIYQRSQPTLGVVAISRNEERDLPGFFENLLPWVDEIVIVDDGSTDATGDIIRNAGDKVKLVEHHMDPATGFGGQRNVGIDAAESDWLLHMDVDERVPPAFAREIREAIKNADRNAYRYRRTNYFLHRPMRGGGLQDWNQCQLARRGKHRFQNIVHEQCIVDGAPETVAQLKNHIWHLNDDSYAERMQKSNVYCHEQARRLVAKQIRLKWYHLLVLPFADFIRKYIIKKGFRDGAAGLLWALHAATASFRACALVWDQQNGIDRVEIESDLRNQWLDAVKTNPEILRDTALPSIQSVQT